MNRFEFDRLSFISLSEIYYQNSLYDSNLTELYNLLKPTTTEKNIEDFRESFNKYQIDDNGDFDEEFDYVKEEDVNINIIGNPQNILGRKTERNDNEITNNINVETNQEKEKLNDIKKSNINDIN